MLCAPLCPVPELCVLYVLLNKMLYGAPFVARSRLKITNSWTTGENTALRIKTFFDLYNTKFPISLSTMQCSDDGAHTSLDLVNENNADVRRVPAAPRVFVLVCSSGSIHTECDALPVSFMTHGRNAERIRCEIGLAANRVKRLKAREKG